MPARTEPASRTGPTAAYLRRLGVDGALAPTHATLVALHRAHLDAVPYENLEIVLGRPPSVDPAACLERIGTVGRGGYCFHQNAALELVLRELGFAVERRHGQVWTVDTELGRGELNHLVLVVSGLPTGDNPDGRWWVDAGLGDAFRDPVAVAVGEHEQGGFRYAVTEVREDGWSFRHDPAGTFTGVEVGPRRVDQRAVAEAHERLSASPDGRFATVLVVARRDATGVDVVRGALHLRVGAAGRLETELASYAAWREALVDATRLSLEGVEEGELRALHDAQWSRHLEWTAAGRP